MASIVINYTIGGDETTADNDLKFYIYNYGNLFLALGSGASDSRVNVSAGTAYISIDVADATTFSFKVREVDEANNLGVLSDAKLITTS